MPASLSGTVLALPVASTQSGDWETESPADA
ncbi:MAG: hypothetical protein V7646_564 [Pseudonocardia sp.]